MTSFMTLHELVDALQNEAIDLIDQYFKNKQKDINEDGKRSTK